MCINKKISGKSGLRSLIIIVWLDKDLIVNSIATNKYAAVRHSKGIGVTLNRLIPIRDVIRKINGTKWRTPNALGATGRVSAIQ